MTKQELTININKVNSLLDDQIEQRQSLYQVYLQELRNYVESFLREQNILDEEVVLSERSTASSWELSRKKEGDPYYTNILTLYVTERYFREEGEECFTDVRASFYTTSENNAFEWERMMLIGKVGRMLLNHSKDLLNAFNTIRTKHSERLSKIGDLIYDLKEQLSEYEKEMRALTKKDQMDQLTSEGLLFEFPKQKPMHIGDYAFWDVERLKINIVGKGTFCNLEINGVAVTYPSKIKVVTVINAISKYRERIVS